MRVRKMLIMKPDPRNNTAEDTIVKVTFALSIKTVLNWLAPIFFAIDIMQFENKNAKSMPNRPYPLIDKQPL
jgi:hypothetical protein